MKLGTIVSTVWPSTGIGMGIRAVYGLVIGRSETNPVVHVINAADHIQKPHFIYRNPESLSEISFSEMIEEITSGCLSDVEGLDLDSEVVAKRISKKLFPYVQDIVALRERFRISEPL